MFISESILIFIQGLSRIIIDFQVEVVWHCLDQEVSCHKFLFTFIYTVSKCQTHELELPRMDKSIND